MKNGLKEFEWGFYALSASKAIFRGRTYKLKEANMLLIILNRVMITRPNHKGPVDHWIPRGSLLWYFLFINFFQFVQQMVQKKGHTTHVKFKKSSKPMKKNARCENILFRSTRGTHSFLVSYRLWPSRIPCIKINGPSLESDVQAYL